MVLHSNAAQRFARIVEYAGVSPFPFIGKESGRKKSCEPLHVSYEWLIRDIAFSITQQHVRSGVALISRADVPNLRWGILALIDFDFLRSARKQTIHCAQFCQRNRALNFDPFECFEQEVNCILSRKIIAVQ